MSRFMTKPNQVVSAHHHWWADPFMYDIHIEPIGVTLVYEHIQANVKQSLVSNNVSWQINIPSGNNLNG